VPPNFFVDTHKIFLRLPSVVRLIPYVCTVLLAGLAAFEARGQTPEPPAGQGAKPARPVDGIRDNSFLIEEAYNQEPGVVQHIFTGRFGIDDHDVPHTRTWDLSFTQEWPVFSQTHQLSYTIPYSFIDADAENESGIGDVLLNYRFQLLNDEGAIPAFSPRFSLIFPSGDEDRGFGAGTCGYQINLPISKTISDRAYVNFNAGVTFTPNADILLSDGDHSDGLDLVSYNLGGSLIYAVTDEFNLLLEVVWNSDEGLEEKTWWNDRFPYADRDRSEDVVISPGLRWAINLPGDLQIVPGLAFPIGLSEDAIDYGVFFYLSIEHPFLPTEK